MAQKGDAARDGDPLRRPYLILLALLGAGLTAVYIGIPQWRAQFQEENQFLENLSALFFLASFLIGVPAYRHKQIRRNAWFCAVIPILGLLGFLDEVHFGADWLGFEPIYLWGSENYKLDGIHDLFTLPFKLWRDLPRGWWDYGVSGLLGLAIGMAVAKRRRYMPWVMRQVRAHPCFDYLRFAVVLVLIAMVVDLGIVDHHFAFYAEELLETLGGFTLCFASLSIHRYHSAHENDSHCESEGKHA